MSPVFVECDPLLCRFCGAEMGIVAFIVELYWLRRMLDDRGC